MSLRLPHGRWASTAEAGSLLSGAIATTGSRALPGCDGARADRGGEWSGFLLSRWARASEWQAGSKWRTLGHL